MSKMMDDGLPSATLTGFSQFRKGYTSLNGAHATSHIEALSPDEIASVLHRRLHISLDRIRRLASCTSDAPRALHKASHHHCDHCITTNATRLSHSADKYSPSYPGRLIHADIAGPFRCSTGKQF